MSADSSSNVLVSIPVDGGRSFHLNVRYHLLKMDGMRSSELVFFFFWSRKCFGEIAGSLLLQSNPTTRLQGIINQMATIQEIRRSLVSCQRVSPTDLEGSLVAAGVTDPAGMATVVLDGAVADTVQAL